ncbi:hypothetical protein BVG16_02080 [Paenibacillus selenitireducens]|uniref:AB hydrolase-1 domain-containing protein n=1 Tax=Paenibacillus selenitireducens TaxID=1324314 RepID=A0A1T2XMP8_9BACL|nr:alpha/beta hydrolase [Paenibacillus selenitireducens]OPA81144.1 hypothetical protein BVG16_02080 [Paenibacillus selenitireducens]
MRTKIWMFPGLNMKAETFEHVQQYFMKQQLSTEMAAVFSSSGKADIPYELEGSEEEEWICIGHGEGGLEAIHMALQYPTKVKAIVTISLNLQPYSVIQHSMLKILARKDVKIGGGLLPFERSSKEELMPYFNTLSLKPSKMLELDAFRKEISMKVREVNQPWLFLYGDKELPVIAKTLQQIKRQVPLIQSNQMPHCGHYLPLEDPKGLEKQIRTFLNQVLVS